ncbi:DUF1361 domain-containing protein [Larkinella punicea]|jgi:uncharacterized membrane protein|uniref:DUF1361 domain-containing protein n=1 Tax=Larkinella punicea TaxID=2315727 RepID=A0A368JUP6_9BACT|nr:DUF1361 domain-containing protein [Larkinella punicea]RCR71377.1 DUF1361 domain-containing protein [Larkinella punicea]
MLNKLLSVYRSGEGLRMLIMLSVMSIAMVVVRQNYWFFKMLSWNLFLAWIPLFVALFLREGLEDRQLPKWTLWPGLVFWLLFLPNSPYIITDLFHVRHVSEETVWFDTMMIFMCALTGLLAGLYSQLLVHRMLSERLGRTQTWVVMIGCLVLTSFGVYLGRYIRLNSWDLFTDPLELAQLIGKSLVNPFALKLTLSYTFALVTLYTGFTQYVQRRTHEPLD